MPKAGAERTRQRVRDIIKLRLAGAELDEILQFAKENAWGVGRRAVQYLMQAADRQLARRFNRDTKAMVAQHATMRMQIYRTALADGDGKLALSVLKDLDALLGLYAAKGVRIEDMTSTSTPTPLSKQEVRDLRDMALRKLGLLDSGTTIAPPTNGHTPPDPSPVPQGAGEAPPSADPSPPPPPDVLQDCSGGPCGPPVNIGQHSAPDPPEESVPLWKQPAPPQPVRRMRPATGPAQPGTEVWLCNACGGRWLLEPGTVRACPTCHPD
jgi:hypothetical protein